MSMESSDDSYFDLESQNHVSVKNGSTKPIDRWRSIGLILRISQAFISSAKKSLAHDGVSPSTPCTVDICGTTNIGVGSHVSVKDGSNSPRHRWRSFFLILRISQAFISGAKKRSLALDGVSPSTQSIVISASSRGGGNVELTIISNSPQTSPDVESVGADDSSKCNKELQNTNIARIMKEKDSDSLRDFGGVRGFAEALDTDLENGLPSDEDHLCCRRLTCPQSEPQAPLEGFLHILWNACNKYIIVLLLLCAVLSLVFGIEEEGLDTEWFEGVFIINAIIILVAVPVIRKYWEFLKQSGRKNREIAVNVFRGRNQHQISISNVVVGDIVCLKKEDRIPADGLFISGESLKLDEELETTIDDQNPFMFYGAKVINGNGRMLVTSIGKDTIWGEMMSNVRNSPNQENPLQFQLDRLNTFIQITGLLITIIILIVLFLRFKFGKQSDGSGFPDLKGKPAAVREFIDVIQKIVMKPRGKTSLLTPSLTMLLLGITEGLPLIVTLAITSWNKKALSGKATAQDFLACITTGLVTTICTDKTCGLTVKQMEVDMFCIGEEFISEESNIDPEVKEALCNGIGARILQRPCSLMEDPLLSWASMRLKLDIENLKQACIIVKAKELHSDEEGCKLLIRKNGDKKERVNSHWKGPASTILAMCSHYYDSKGRINSIDEQKRMAFQKVIEHRQGKHLKTFAFGYKPNDVSELEETDLILLGLVGLKHSIRRVVEACIDAGVNIKLVSECHVSELEALECGLNIENSDSVVLGENFRNSTPEGRLEMVDRICVMVNSRPSDKLLLVKCLKQKGHIVAMVGERTYDTPAIKEADVGITIGKFSTEMARESSNIVISDGGFNFVFTIMKYGRCAFENIQKFIQIELTMTIAWFLINIITTVCLGDAPITAIQVCWVYFIVTFTGGLALLTEPPTEKLMNKSPVRLNDMLITRTMWRNIVPQALYQAAILVTFQFKGQAALGIGQNFSKTMTFNSFVLCQVFNWFSTREMEKKNVFKGLHQNCWFWVAMVVTMVLQEAFTEIAHILASSARLNLEQWAICFLIGVVSWVIDWAGKCTWDFIANRFTRQPCSGMTLSDSSESLINLGLPLINDSTST